MLTKFLEYITSPSSLFLLIILLLSSLSGMPLSSLEITSVAFVSETDIFLNIGLDKIQIASIGVLRITQLVKRH
jgi:hypothetical protein